MKHLTIDAQITQLRELTPRIREYQIMSLDGARLPSYDPGAHIELHLTSPQLGPFVRHYSLIGGDGAQADASNIYRIAVQREGRGRGSDYIHQSLAVGSRVRISRPHNNFLLGRNDERSLLIAGGIGITPIYAMLRSLVRRKRDFEFVYSGRTPESLAYREEVLTLAAERGSAHFSGEHAERPLDLHGLLSAQSDDTVVYVCGPAVMVEATHRVANALGWPESRVRSEYFAVGNSQNDVGFNVILARSGRQIAVGPNTSILDALTAEGIDLLYDCRRGECGLCPLTVLDANGHIEHRDRYLSSEERSGGKTMCVCVSRLQGECLTLDV